MLTLDNVTVTYPDGGSTLTAVDSASLSIDPGHIAAVTGPSGSGKSTLLAVASTMLTPDSGRVIINGADTAGLSGKERARVRRNQIGIVFQAPNLIPALTVAENLKVMAKMGSETLRGMKKRQLDEHIHGLITEVGLADRANFLPSALSGGQRQRVNIARALVHNPSVLVVDEPTSALDTRRTEAVFELLVNLTHERNVATLVVTHDVDYLKGFDSEHHMVDGVLSPAVPAAA